MQYEKVRIKRDTQTTYTKDVPPWEVPILEQIFEEGNVTRLDEFVTVQAEYPDPAFEFDRLVRAYGADNKSGIAHVAAVYGDSGRGIRELRKAMDEARAREAASNKAPASRQRKARTASADPLMV